MGDRPTEVGLCGLPHLSEDEGARLRRRVAVTPSLDPRVAAVAAYDGIRRARQVLLHVCIIKSPADKPLCGEESALRVRNRLPLSRSPHEFAAVVGESDDRRCRACALCILNDLCGATLHDSNA
mmetsp:Transcript_40513/g.81246  ORF Transcript_40513/g.81246 Transcript_40513/m.81246 type:complete len:124 (+) Transcript_40513:1892-2263(+)